RLPHLLAGDGVPHRSPRGGPVKSRVLAAGAGTGKTTALVRLALDRYAGEDGPPLDPTRVWAVTVAEKAGGELSARLLGRTRALGGLYALRRAVTTLAARVAEEGLDPSALVDGPSGSPLPAFDPEALRPRLPPAAAALASAFADLGRSDHPRLAGMRETLER